MGILEQLWYGNLEPQIIPVEKGSELETVMSASSACLKELMEKMPKELYGLFEKERELYTSANALREVKVFVQGFRYAMRIAAEVYVHENESSMH